MKKLLLAMLLLSISIYGCTTVPVSFDVKNIQPATKKLDGELKLVSVSFAGNEIPWSAEMQAAILTNWKSALENALDKSKIFQEDSSRKFNLEVSILTLNPGVMAYDVNVVSEYIISDRKTRELINKQVVESTGHASDFVGETRVNKSLSSAVQSNISQYLLKISSP